MLPRLSRFQTSLLCRNQKLYAPPLQVLTLTARTESALAELAQKYEQFLNEKPDLDLADVCYSASTGRAHFEHRLTVLAADLPEAKERLGQFQRGEKHRRIRSRRAISSASPGVVFMFTGQGSQYVGMGRELFETQPVFRRELERCAEILRPLLDQTITGAALWRKRGESCAASARRDPILSARAFRAGVCAGDHVAFLGCGTGRRSRS